MDHQPTEPIRILYLIDDLWSSRGGSEQHLLWLLEHIPEPEFEKHFIIFSSLWKPDPIILRHHPIVLGEQLGTGWKSWLKRVRFIARFVRDHRIDLIQAFSPMGELAGFAALRFAGRGRLIGNRRDCGYDRRWKYRLIRRFCRYFGTQYVANSEAAKRASCEQDGTRPDRIHVIRNPVPVHRMLQSLEEPMLRSELPIPEAAKAGKIIGMVATVRPIKDYATLIRAARLVVNEEPQAWFLFVGEQRPAHLAELKEIAEKENISDRIIWFGSIDNPLKLIPNLDVAVLSSHSESFSNTVLEYAAAERPIVVSDVGGLGEMILHDQTGLLVPAQAPAEMAQNILKLLKNPEHATQLGLAAKKIALSENDDKKILEQYIGFYRTLAGKNE